MTTTLLPYDEASTGATPTACIIWLHGLGADSQQFIPLAQSLKLNVATRFICPQAPSRPVTVNGGMIMPSWYDIISMNIEREIDTTQIIVSAKAIHQFIDQQIEKGIASNNIILAGFSQGGAVAYHAALTYGQTLGGLIALSTYFATDSMIEPQACNQNLPILIQHGTQDMVVPEVLGQRSVTALRKISMQSQYLTYPTEHSICPDQIYDMNQWLNTVLGSASKA